MVHNAKKIKINCLEFKDTPSAHAHKQTHIYIIQNFLKTLLEEKKWMEMMGQQLSTIEETYTKIV